MRILVQWAHERSPNLGVAALARGSRDLLLRTWPDAEMEFVNYGHRPSQLPFGRHRSLLRERVLDERGMRAWLSSFDLMWDTRSGDSFSDIYGLRRHSIMGAVFELAVATGVPGVLAPQTIGPFHTKAGRMLARRTLRRARLVMARDLSSADAAASLGRPVDVVTSDLVFAIDQPPPAPPRDVVLNISGLLWSPNPHVDHVTYRKTVHRVIEGLIDTDRDVTLLAHVRGSSTADDDAQAVRECAERHRLEPVIPTDLDEARSVLGAAVVVIGSRMHACLNALSTGVPALPLAYSRKFAPLLTDLGWEHVVDLRKSRDPADELLSVTGGGSVQDGHGATQDLRRQAMEVRDRGRALTDKLGEILRAVTR